MRLTRLTGGPIKQNPLYIGFRDSTGKGSVLVSLLVRVWSIGPIRILVTPLYHGRIHITVCDVTWSNHPSFCFGLTAVIVSSTEQRNNTISSFN